MPILFLFLSVVVVCATFHDMYDQSIRLQLEQEKTKQMEIRCEGQGEQKEKELERLYHEKL